MMKMDENDMMICGDLSLDDLLNFSTEEEAQLLSEPLPCPTWDDPPLSLPLPFTAQPIIDVHDSIITPPTTIIDTNNDDDDDGALLCDDLDVTQLEWLSNFVEESFSPSATLLPVNVPIANGAGIKKDTNGDGPAFRYRTPSPVSVLCNYASSSSSPSSSTSSGGVTRPANALPEPAARAPRTKRPRPPSFSPSASLIPFSADNDNSGEPDPPIAKKKKAAKQATVTVEASRMPTANPSASRKCMHCEIQKTPQWRAGPMGPKTLCNACGVRYKSGRLFPEYRPAASPTFMASQHSNSHKKVVEMRNKSGTVADAVPAGAPVALKGCELLNYIKGGLKGNASAFNGDDCGNGDGCAV